MSAPNDPPLAETPYRVGPISRRRAFAYVALAVAGFVAATLLIHLALPPVNPEGVGVKLRFFAEHKDDFDTLIVGTSHVNYSVNPETFDGVTRSEGQTTHTFNFGMYSLHPPENFFVVEQILKTQPTKLKWVLIELENIVTTPDPENKSARRVRYWHDWPRTKLVMQKLLNPRGRSGTLGEIFRAISNRRDVALDFALFAQELVSRGRVADVISGENAAEAKLHAVELGPKRDGYRPPHEPMSGDAVQQYQAKLALECGSSDSATIDMYAEHGYRDAAARVRRIGAQIVFVVTPVMSQTQLKFRGTPPGPILSFNDCRRYPQLYKATARVDENHLSQEGGEEFTRLLAHELARLPNEN